MTMGEAVKIINCYDMGFYDLNGEKISADKLADAFDMAIEALDVVSKGDLISRAEAIEAVCDKCPISFKEKCEWRDNGHCSMKVALESLPSKRPKEWWT